MTRTAWPIPFTAILVVAACLAGGHEARAQAARANCSRLLDDATVEGAIGRTGAAVEKDEPSPGDSRCVWAWDDGGTSVTVTVAHADAIAARAADTRCCPGSAPLVAQFFDYVVRSAVDLGAEPPAPLTGLGVRGALFFEEGFLKLVVQRSDAVAQVVGAGISREQLLAVGRAVAREPGR